MVVLARDETASLIAIFADGRYEVLASGVAIPLWTQRGLVWAPPPGNSVVAVRGDGDDGFALLTGTGDGESAVWTDITFNHDGVQTGAHAMAPHDAFATANAELAYGLDLDGDGSIGFEAVETLIQTSTETSTETSAPSVVRQAEGGLGVRDGGGMTVQGGAGDDQHMDEGSFSASGTIINDGAADAGRTGHPEHLTPGPDHGSDSPPQPDDALSLLVKFAPGTSMANVMAAASAVGGGVGDVVRGEGSPLNPGGVLQTFSLGRGVDPDLAIQILNRLPGVEYAERNWTVSIETLSVEETSTDPYYSGGNLWGMYGDDTSPNNQYGSQAADAWLTGQTGSMSSVVGVIDTGIDPTHVDLYLNIWLNQEEIPSALAVVLNDVDGDGLITFRDLNHSDNSAHVSDRNGNGRIDARDLLADGRWADGVDTDGNGFIDDFYGWDFHNDDNDPFDDQGHGTHVAGTIGALSNNSGVVGVAWNVQIMALKFLSSSGTGNIADAVRATDYFTLESQSPGQHFVATNNSWGGGGYSSTMEQAIVDGAIADILFVASAGNGRWPRGGGNNDKSDHYPSDYDTTLGAGYDAVVAVASIDSNGNLSSFSNYGAVDVDLGAPGSSIWSTAPGGGYANYSGTSMAAPHVTGSLALAASLSPGTSAEDLRDALLASTTFTQSLDGRTVTDGRLNVEAFLYDLDTVAVDPTPVVGVHPLITNDTTPALTGTVDDPAATISVTVDSQNFLATNNGNGTWTLSDNTLSPLLDGVYDVVVTADAGGNVGSDSTTGELTIDTIDPEAPSVAALTTNDTTPTVTGTAGLAAGETLSVHVAGTDYTEGNGLTLDGSNWSLTVGDPLTDGAYDVTATVTDAAGNSTNDATSGELVVDTTGPVEGDLFVFGTDGSDTLVGSGLADTISGLPNSAEGSTALGEKTIDVLTGMGGNDVFVLGDSRGAFYDDGSSRPNNGELDYAQINDFTAGDQIHLSGSPADYLLVPWTTQEGAAGTGIFINYGNGNFDSRDELIGLVAGVSLDNLSGTDFVYNDDFLYV